MCMPQPNIYACKTTTTTKLAAAAVVAEWTAAEQQLPLGCRRCRCCWCCLWNSDSKQLKEESARGRI